MFPSWRPFVFVIFGFMVVAGVFLFTAPGGSKAGPGSIFDVAWCLVVVWNAYWFLYRVSYRIEMEGDQIRWFTPLRHGEFAVDDLVSISSSPLTYQISTFKRKSGPSVIIMVQRGLSEFAQEVHQRAPQVAVKTGLYQKLMRTS